MILTDQQLKERRFYCTTPNERDYLDTIADLKRQLAEREATLGLGAEYGFNFDWAALDAYVQEKVDRAVLAESEWWGRFSGHSGCIAYSEQGCLGAQRLAANRAKVAATPADPPKEK